MRRTMQHHTRLRLRRSSFITVALIIVLIVIIWPGVTVVNRGDTPIRFATQFMGRDAEIARQSAELERVSAALAVLQRMVFGDSSERSRPEPPAPQDEGGEPAPGGTGGSKGRPRGPGARAGRRDYSHLPRVEVIWDFEGGGVLLPGVRDAVHGAGQRSCHGAAGLAGDRPGDGALPAPVPAGLRLPGSG